MMMEIQPVDPEFVRVWSRVRSNPAQSGAAGTAPGAEEDSWGEFLTGKIRAEVQRAREYRMLGLPAPLRESVGRAKKLSAAWFFRSGERYLPRPQGRPNRYPSPALAVRQLYQEEQRSEEDYRKAAEACGDEALRQVFTFCAHSCQDTRRALWEAVERGLR